MSLIGIFMKKRTFIENTPPTGITHVNVIFLSLCHYPWKFVKTFTYTIDEKQRDYPGA